MEKNTLQRGQGKWKAGQAGRTKRQTDCWEESRYNYFEMQAGRAQTKPKGQRTVGQTEVGEL